MKKLLFCFVVLLLVLVNSANCQVVDNITTNFKLAAGNNPGQLMRLINNVFSNNDDIAPYQQSVNGLWVQFNLKAAAIVNQITWYQGQSRYNGDFKVQASNNGSMWADVSGNFQLGNTTQTKMTFGNSTAYLYYRLLGIAGTMNSVYWWEVQFNTPVNIPPPVTSGGMDTTWINKQIILISTAIARQEINKLDSLTLKTGDIRYDTLKVSNKPGVKYKLEKY